MVVGRQQRTPTLSDVIYKILSSWSIDLHVALPGRVESYDNDAQTVDVKLGINAILTDDDGEPQQEELPTLHDIPVVFPRAGDFFMSFPLSHGDYVLVVFCERPIDQWRSLAGSPVPGLEPVAPGLRSMHDLNGAVAIPGVYPAAKKLSETSGNHMVIGKEGGQQIAVEKDSGEVHVGTSSSLSLQYVALANKVKSEISAMLAAGAASPPPGNGGFVVAQTYWDVTPGADVSSSNLKAEEEIIP